MKDTPTETEPESLPCPYCRLEIQMWFGPAKWRGRANVRTQSLTHRLPACDGFLAVGIKVDGYLDLARAARASRAVSPDGRLS